MDDEDEFGRFYKHSKHSLFFVGVVAVLVCQWETCAFSCFCRGGGPLPIPTGKNHPRMERSSGEAEKESKEKGNQSSAGGSCAIFVKDSTKV